MSDFSIDDRDLRKLQGFFKKMPHELPRATANVLNGLAFEARKTDIDILKQNLIIRNPKFLESSIQVQKARPGRIEQQIALVGSIHRSGSAFTGWEEQETGEAAKQKPASIAARGGSKRGVIKPHARFRPGRKRWRPEQFQGRNLRQRFQFMMRVLGSRGGQQAFYLSSRIPTKAGGIGPGLFGLAKHRIMKLRMLETKRINRLPWNERMIHTLQQRNAVSRLWGRELGRLKELYKK